MDKVYLAGIEIYQLGKTTTLKFFDGYNPEYNSEDGALRGRDHPDFAPMGEILIAFAGLVEDTARQNGLLAANPAMYGLYPVRSGEVKEGGR